jgi:hypothetical protein
MAAMSTSVAEAPGVYALLLGSGISQGAGVATGWGVAMELATKIARANGVELDLDDHEAIKTWWRRHSGEDVTYSGLLDELAWTPGHAQSVLRDFFERGRDGQRLSPSVAHERIAGLAADGHVKVIVTTNFDHLMEDALHARGVAPQVIRTSDDVAGMIPLQHAGVTIIKLHGDFMSLSMRNSVQELSEYPKPLAGLLDRVLDEYGLIVMGWSARWDHALGQALRARINRRYPCWWATTDDLGSEAREIVAVTGLRTLSIADADSWAADLSERIRLATSVRQPSLRFARAGDPPELDGRARRSGWVKTPLLQIEVECRWAPQDRQAIIRAEEREAVLESLAGSRVTSTMEGLRSRLRVRPPMLDHAGTGEIDNTEDHLWTIPPGAGQSTVLLVNRWGTDGSTGISALASVNGLRAHTGDRWTASVCLGLSLRQPIGLIDLAHLLDGGMDLVLTVVRGLPPTIGLSDEQFHLTASLAAAVLTKRQEGRTVDLPTKLDSVIALDELGPPSTREVRQSMGFGYTSAPDVTPAEVSEIVVSGMEYMFYARGWTDPRAAIREIRAALRDDGGGSDDDG